MTLEDKINSDIKEAMLAKDKAKLEALRAVKAAVLLVKTSKPQGEEITPEEEIQTLQRLVKQRKEASQTYKEQNREDLYKEEIFQLEIIEKYLPKQLSEEEIRETLKTIISSLGATSQKDMGKVMQTAQKTFAGQADNKIVSQIVKELLG